MTPHKMRGFLILQQIFPPWNHLLQKGFGQEIDRGNQYRQTLLDRIFASPGLLEPTVTIRVGAISFVHEKDHRENEDPGQKKDGCF